MTPNKKQLNFFDNLIVEGETWTNSIELFDSLPIYNYHRVTRRKDPVIIKKSCGFKGADYDVKLIPGVYEDSQGEAWTAINGKREEIILHVIRYFASQDLDSLDTHETLSKDSKQESSKKPLHVSVKFTLHELRKELKRIGHQLKLSDIRESLEILNRSILQIKSGDYWSSGSLIESMYGADNDEGSMCVVLHPLASQAIISGATRLLRYDKFMSIKKPLARWIYKQLCHVVTNAACSSPIKGRGIGFKFSYKTVFEQSCLQELKDRRNNVRTIREALKELADLKLLQEVSLTGFPFEETEKGNVWIAFPSNETVSDIMHANKSSSLRPHENLILECDGPGSKPVTQSC